MKICERIGCGKEHDGSFGSGRFCSMFCANQRKHSDETKRKISEKVTGIESHNKGKTKFPKIHTICPICQQPFSFQKTYKDEKDQIFCSWLCYTKDTQTGHKFSTKVSGGYRRGSCKSNGGFYKGIWCDSTYELVWVIYNLENNISFERNEIGFPYRTPDGKDHLYYPDFKIGDEYIETKNYLKENDQYKIQQFPHKLTILFGNDLKQQFNYVHQKYGKNLKALYDGARNGI